MSILHLMKPEKKVCCAKSLTPICRYSPCILVASIQVVDVHEVGDMDVSRRLVGKYRIVNQVQQISCVNPNTQPWLTMPMIQVCQPCQLHTGTCPFRHCGLSFVRMARWCISSIFTASLSKVEGTWSMGLAVVGKCSRQDGSFRLMIIYLTDRWKEDISWCHFSRNAFIKSLFAAWYCVVTRYDNPNRPT